MWAITHIPTGTVLKNFDGTLFYSEKEARKFFRQLRNRLKKLASLYVESTLVYSKTGLTDVHVYGILRCAANRRTHFDLYRNVRFYRATLYEKLNSYACNRILFYCFKTHNLAPTLTCSELLNVLTHFNTYFVIHRVN